MRMPLFSLHPKFSSFSKCKLSKSFLICQSFVTITLPLLLKVWWFGLYWIIINYSRIWYVQICIADQTEVKQPRKKIEGENSVQKSKLYSFPLTEHVAHSEASWPHLHRLLSLSFQLLVLQNYLLSRITFSSSNFPRKRLFVPETILLLSQDNCDCDSLRMMLSFREKKLQFTKPLKQI